MRQNSTTLRGGEAPAEFDNGWRLPIVAAMLRRVGWIALLVFQAFWLNVVVPGHTRGVITLPGSPCDECPTAPAPAAAQSGRSCCALPSPARDSRSNVPVRSGNEAARCAICHFAVGLSVPPAIDLSAPPLRLLALSDPPTAYIGESASPLLTYFGRGPPLA